MGQKGKNCTEAVDPLRSVRRSDALFTVTRSFACESRSQYVIPILAARRCNRRVGLNGRVLRTWVWGTMDQIEGYRATRVMAGIDE